MEQRPLRLGDILDDYCPRERRVTNHAIVAMIEEDVRQTRCVTCDAEHAYKGGKAPRRRPAKETPASLYREVLAGIPDVETGPVLTASLPAPDVADEPAGAAATVDDTDALSAAPSAEAPGAEPPDGNGAEEPSPAIEEGPVHRPLIRATLPRPEGQKETRQIPDFTMRQPLGRGRFRGGAPRMRQRGGGNGHGPGAGNRPHGGSRFGGPRPGGPGGRGPRKRTR